MLLEVVQPECGINTDENQDQLRRPTAQSRPKCNATSCFAHKGNDLWARQFSKRKEIHTRPRKNRVPGRAPSEKKIYPPHFEIGIFPISLSGRRPIVLPRLFRQSSLVKMTSPVRLDPADRLILLRRLDRFRKWQSLDDRQLSEVLAHHRHVLDSYRLGIMRRLDAALATPTRKRRSKG